MTDTSPLQSEIKRLIQSAGPMPVWRYMELCLTHPRHGYYVSRDPLGREGDFTTSPEVSQMFGELIGLWAASVWKAIGSPPVLRLIELGPGRGTMMADALRAVRVLPPLYQALIVHLVEINPVLREKEVIVARQMLPLFEADPSGWAAVCYLNLGTHQQGKSLAQNFSEWQNNSPAELRPFLGRLTALFSGTA